MGYDHDECVICYLNGGGNNPSPIRRVCAVCIEAAHDGGGYSGRVASECSQNQAYGGTCNLCRKDRIFTFEVGLCNNCLQRDGAPPPTEIQLVYYDGTDDDDDCDWISIIRNPSKAHCDGAIDDIVKSPEGADLAIRARYDNQVMYFFTRGGNWLVNTNRSDHIIESGISSVKTILWRFIKGESEDFVFK